MVLFKETSAIFAIIVVCAVLSFFSRFFFTFPIWNTILSYASPIAVVAVGMTVLMVSGEFDLSVGSVFAMTASMTFHWVSLGMNVWIATALSLSIACLAGLLNGVVVVKIGVNSLITTLGTGYLFLTLGLVSTSGYVQIPPTDPLFQLVMGKGSTFGITNNLLWIVAIAILCQLLLSKTRHGNWTMAVGGGRAAAGAMGVNVARVKMMNFVLCSFLAGLAGLITLTRINAASAISGMGLELETIAAVVVGGTALYGGSGTVIGSMLGALLLGIIFIGVNIAGVSSYWFEGISGVVLVVTAILNQRIYKLRRRSTT
jgi:simple sugar transport system permease protein